MDSFSSLEVGINDETVCLWLFKLFIFLAQSINFKSNIIMPWGSIVCLCWYK